MIAKTKRTNLSEIILGGQDGLVNVLGVVLGLAAATQDSRVIIAGGLAATFAESISMGAVVYTSKGAERDQYAAVVAANDLTFDGRPAEIDQQLRTIYAEKGFEGHLLDSIVAQLMQNKAAAVETLLNDGTELVPSTRADIIMRSLLTFVAAVIGSLIPLSAFFVLPVAPAVIVSFLISGLALFAIGAYVSMATVKRPVRSGLQLTIIGLASALAGYLIGLIFR